MKIRDKKRQPPTTEVTGVLIIVRTQDVELEGSWGSGKYRLSIEMEASKEYVLWRRLMQCLAHAESLEPFWLRMNRYIL